MKKIILCIILLTFGSLSLVNGQWFQTYTDSIVLVTDANEISNTFIADIKKIKPNFVFDGKTILDTSPALIYYGFDKNIHLPFWEQVPPQLKGFFTEITGSETEGNRMFGLFFNGFYLLHELGHAFQDVVDGILEQSYHAEYFANTIAMLWFRKHGYQKELEQCYNFAKAMESKLPNPVPKGKTIADYFTENYGQASQNPYSYGYMQFKQFVQIYEDKSLSEFDIYISEFLNTK